MKSCLLTRVLLAILVSSCPLATAQIPDDFTSLIGADLSGWHGNNPHTTQKAPADQRDAAIEAQQAEFLEHWRLEEGALVNDGLGPYATTNAQFGDIELIVDYQTVAKADSGIYLRGTPQIQIWDTTKEGGKWDRHADKGSGGLFNNTHGQPGQLPLVLADKPFGQWNHFRILQIGARTWVELNHKLVVDGAIMENYWDRSLPLPARGPIHLQTHGGEIRWKHIGVREIDADEAISRLRGDDALAGFEPIFNGNDLTGWAGAVNDYEVREGAIVCKPGKGGVLFTEETYDDFAVRVEFQIPPGGNNGLAIRYPGTGRASYDGMCELQVLDDTAEKYAKLDPRQYHGSVYGIAPAHRGYLRPAGQWNYQEVTVQGSRIRVELNGTTIVDADVSQIREYKDDAAHPGVNLKSGHFGFAGHNDPVAFRRVAIKRLSARPTSGTSNQASQDALGMLRGAMIMHASFDDTTDLNLFKKDGWIYTAPSTKRQDAKQGMHIPSVNIARGQGKYRDALQFKSKAEQVLFYQGTEIGYRPENWSGSLSLWMKLDPNKDLAPGFCDPIQMTERGWNDGAFFIDFDKELPRAFRLGAFPDYKSWNPQDTNFDDIPVEQRPMVSVAQPPFSAEKWTHVCFTWDQVNAADEGRPATTTLYLDGQPQGSVVRPMRFTWEPKQAALMVGVYYVGLIDDLLVFDKPLTAEQVKLLFEHPVGGLN
ncbi:MAG: family 16 glycoside hydrolase [Pirellulaceae bacterium]